MMTELDPKKNAPQQNPREATPRSKQAPKGDYLVGKWRHQLKPGGSRANPGIPRVVAKATVT